MAEDVAGCLRGWSSLEDQLGSSSLSARGSMTAPETICDPVLSDGQRRHERVTRYRRTNFPALFEDDDSEVLPLFLLELLETYSSTEAGRASSHDADINILRDSLYGCWIKGLSSPW